MQYLNIRKTELIICNKYRQLSLRFSLQRDLPSLAASHPRLEYTQHRSECKDHRGRRLQNKPACPSPTSVQSLSSRQSPRRRPDISPLQRQHPTFRPALPLTPYPKTPSSARKNSPDR